MPLLVKVTTPLRLEDIDHWSYPEEMLAGVRDAGLDLPEPVRLVEYLPLIARFRAGNDVLRADLRATVRALRSVVMAEIATGLRAAGYDGLEYRNTFEGGGFSHAVLSANQLKSATANNGHFSRSNDDVRH
jgi:hypothetical protein